MEPNLSFDIGSMPDILHIIIRDDDVFTQIKKDYPEILADLTTLKTNPNCTCRGKVGKFFSDKLASEPTVLDKYIKDRAAVASQIDQIRQKRLENVIGGKVFKVSLGDDAWSAFNRQIQGKVYRGFSVVKEFDYLMVYFL